MATVQYYMNYVIFFSDETEYNFAISVSGSNLLQIAPRAAAVLFGIPYPYPSGNMEDISKGIYFIAPYGPGEEFFFPLPSGILIDDTVVSQTVPGQVGNPSGPWPAGPDGVFTWSANIVLSAGAGSAISPPANPMSQRRWIGGRELAGQFEGGSSVDLDNICRDASRTIDGCGIVIRGQISTNAITRNLDEFRVGLTSKSSWERFYIRVRQVPSTNPIGIWRAHAAGSPLGGTALKIELNGTIGSYDISSTNVETSKGTVFTPTINQWYRIDIFLRFNGGGGSGIIVVYVDGVSTFTYTVSSGSGLGQSTNHDSSELGKWTSATDNACEVDLDDWINADLPANLSATTLTFIDNNYPIDWLLGSHVRLHYTLVPSQTNWSPAGMAEGVLNQAIYPSSRSGTSELTSTTSGATLEGLTDLQPSSIQDSIANVLGGVAAIVVAWSKTSDGSDGTLGYKLAGGTAVMATAAQATTEGQQKVMYLPSGMVLPDEMSPWSVVHDKAANTATDTTYMVVTVVEHIGVWGPEDDPLWQFPISRLTFLHNALYGNTAWGYLGSQPAAPVFAVGGTYLGNGTFQEVELPGPCHFLWIRRTTGTDGGVKMFGSSLGLHTGVASTVIPNIRMFYDSISETFKMAITGGASSVCNISGVTYQYIAFCDPGMRFNLCGAFAHGSGVSTPANALIASGFLPTAGFVQREQITSSNSGLWFKGPGHSGNTGELLSGTAEANFGNFAAGVFNNGSGLNSILAAYSLWRTDDSGGACASNVMVQILGYTGNGAGSQVITLTPTSSRFPLFVLVVPANNSASFFVDPSHAAGHASNVNTLADSTTVITAVGMDSITVAGTLNTTGIGYSVFVICGDTAGMNNGEYYATYCDGDGPYVNPSPSLGDINIIGSGGLLFDGTTPMTLLRDISGIYTLVPGKRNDTFQDRQTGQTDIDLKIPDPTFKTGYVGG